MSSPARPTTACYRCREQKLRCSRDSPQCDRCSRLNIQCKYPSPPDRKRLAKFRAPPRKRDVDQYALSHGTNGDRPHSTGLPEHYHDVSSPGTDISLDELPIDLQHALQDVYFTYVFHATLVFHQPTFMLAFEKHCLPRHVLLAVYAMATAFLSPNSGAMKKHAAVFQQAGDLKALGRNWATRAGREVLQTVDQPTLESIQTCIALGLYWFSAGESLRNIMFSGIAYKAACALEMDSDGANVTSIVATSLPRATSAWLQAELLRRVFWAVWLSQSLNGNHSATGSLFSDQVMSLSLPVSERAFTDDTAEPSITLLSIADRRNREKSKNLLSGPVSIKAEGTSLIQFWSKVRKFIATRATKSRKDWLADLFDLDMELQSWCSDLPPSVQYSKDNLHKHISVNEQPDYISLHAIYYQSRLALHTSIVPQFSGVSAQDSTAEVINVSAQTAARTAQKLSDLAADMLALDWDAAKLASFVGYCMYVPATIHIALLASKNIETVTLARKNLIPCLRVLDTMKTHWAHLQRLWVRVHVLYGAQMSQIRASINSTTTIANGTTTITNTNSPTTVNDLEELAGQPRKAGQLSEPLSDSVLQYTLSRLKPNTTESPHDHESNHHSEELAQLMDDELRRVQQQHQRPENVLQRHNEPSTSAASTFPNSTTNTGMNNYNHNIAVLPISTQPVNMMSNVTAFDPMQTDNVDWWALSMDNLQFPDLPYDYLFGFDFNTT